MRKPFPAAIPLVPFLSGDQSGVGEGGGPWNRCVDVYGLGRSLSRATSYSSSVFNGGARVCRESEAIDFVRFGMEETVFVPL
uniref:Uncharacterized protein n=1 Tax=Setaria italica TaxID=4555 RepID=K4AHE8_SETIT